MNKIFLNKVVLVTGAGSGIGLECGKKFLSQGAKVVFAVKNMDHKRIEKVSDLKNTAVMQCDVRVEEEIKKMIEEIIKRYKKIDVLVNNAGVDQPCPLVDITKDHWNYIMDTNVTGLVMCCKYVAKEMIKRKSGKIINMSSIAGKEGVMYHSAYVASKHAVIGITKCIAQELIKFSINVNAVCPGLIETKLLRKFFEDYSKITNIDASVELRNMINKTPFGQMGRPADVAALVVFLCTDAAKNIVGQAINTDGGILQH